MNRAFPPRSRWQRALHQHDRERLISLADELSAGGQVRPCQVPQAGLGMLRLREPSYGEVFNIGEIPLACVALEVTSADGDQAAGGAFLMDDDLDLAQAIAVCDAILSGGLRGHETVSELILDGDQALADEDRLRAGLLARTAVHFDTLEEAT